jgi:hypothetical protein
MFRKLQRSTSWVIAVGTLLLSALSASAATYYVAPNGSDSNPGTLAQPFRTVRHGVSALSGGDTLRIRGGTYNEILNPDYGVDVSPKSGSPTNPTIIEGYADEMPVIRSPYQHGDATIHIEGAWFILRNFVIDAGNVEDTPLSVGGNNHRLENLELRNSINYGFNDFSVDSLYNRIWVHDINCIEWSHTGCQGSGTQFPNAAGGYLRGLRVTVENSIFERVKGVGITDRHGTLSTVRNNIFRNNDVSGASMTCGDAGANWPGHPCKKTYYNNIAYNNGFHGFAPLEIQDLLMYNNVAYGNGQWGLNNGWCGENSPAHVILRNNIFTNNGSGAWCGPNITQSNNLTADPGFVNASAGDFHLTANSRAINAGMTLPEVPCDFAGDRRPVGGAYDIGAYEYKDSVLPAPANLRIVKK